MAADPFRAEYRQLSQAEAANIARIKMLASDLLGAIQDVPTGREKALAVTKLQEAVFWAVSGITG